MLLQQRDLDARAGQEQPSTTPAGPPPTIAQVVSSRIGDIR
ncbi:hypothetical protein I552_9532 [Mycobacterium xenopi 3993]|nr:hypothetical protein I552_9532 [Mycobacterium xenopi 3993]